MRQSKPICYNLLQEDLQTNSKSIETVLFD